VAVIAGRGPLPEPEEKARGTDGGRRDAGCAQLGQRGRAQLIGTIAPEVARSNASFGFGSKTSTW
jgi:hypothetical protein